MTTTFDTVNVRLHYVVCMMLGRSIDNIELVLARPSPATLSSVLAELANEFGGIYVDKVYNHNTAVFNSGLSIVINGSLIDPRQIPETKLPDNAEVFIFPLYKGG